MTGGFKNGSEGANGFAEKIESRGETLESAPAQRSGFRQKSKRHCARFWWLHLIIFIIGFLLIALLLVYVGMPRIAQSLVNKSSLKFYELQFLNPTPNSVVLNQTAQLHNPSVFTPTLDSFAAGLWLVTNGQYAANQFTSIQFPTIHALHPDTNVTTLNQVLAITDLDQLADYAIQVISQQNVTTALVGKTNLHEGALPVTSINYNSSTTYAALNGLAGFQTLNLTIDLTGKVPNLHGTAFVPNPSVMTVEMGNVTLELSTASQGVVGVATINDLTIRPGENFYPMFATVDQGKVILSETPGSGGIAEVFITGNSSTYNGQRIPYYEKALASNKLTLPMNVTDILKNSTQGS